MTTLRPDQVVVRVDRATRRRAARNSRKNQKAWERSPRAARRMILALLAAAADMWTDRMMMPPELRDRRFLRTLSVVRLWQAGLIELVAGDDPDHPVGVCLIDGIKLEALH